MAKSKQCTSVSDADSRKAQVNSTMPMPAVQTGVVLIPTDKVPPKFIKRLKAVGWPIVKSGNTWLLNEEMIGTSDMWDRAGAYMGDLGNVRVSLAPRCNPIEWDPVYLPPLSENGRRLNMGFEIQSMIKSQSPYERPGFPIQFPDAAFALPSVVKLLMDPPASCPISHAAPDGVYLASLFVMFTNIYFEVRIHRKRAVTVSV